jgi:hypothetical protein
MSTRGGVVRLYYEAGSDSDGEEPKNKSPSYYQRENPIMRATVFFFLFE